MKTEQVIKELNYDPNYSEAEEFISGHLVKEIDSKLKRLIEAEQLLWNLYTSSSYRTLGDFEPWFITYFQSKRK